MCKIDFNNMSITRKLALTILGAFYALAVLGNVFYHGSLIGVIGATIFFLVLTGIVFLWVK